MHNKMNINMYITTKNVDLLHNSIGCFEAHAPIDLKIVNLVLTISYM